MGLSDFFLKFNEVSLMLVVTGVSSLKWHLGTSCFVTSGFSNIYFTRFKFLKHFLGPSLTPVL